jgi:hypothetical protein
MRWLYTPDRRKRGQTPMLTTVDVTVVSNNFRSVTRELSLWVLLMFSELTSVDSGTQEHPDALASRCSDSDKYRAFIHTIRFIIPAMAQLYADVTACLHYCASVTRSRSLPTPPGGMGASRWTLMVSHSVLRPHCRCRFDVTICLPVRKKRIHE